MFGLEQKIQNSKNDIKEQTKTQKTKKKTEREKCIKTEAENLTKKTQGKSGQF